MKMLLYILIIIIIIAITGGIVLYNYQDKMVFHPEDIPKDFPYSFNGNYEELFIKTDDSEINAIHFRIDNPKGVILYFHGNAGALNTWGLLGEEFIKTGYDFFVFDYRGYGKSEGIKSEKGFHKDCKKIYEYVTGRYPEDKIVIYGRSLGTGFATRVASENNPKVMILETPYFSFRSIAQQYFPYIPVTWVLKYTIRTDQWITKVQCPILIFHGTDDEIIPYENSILLKKLLKAEDTYITVEHATHNNIPLFPEYLLYLEKYLK